ncbi:MAG: integration host factor subunit beta [Candidatus Dadabacteria bacterium]|nr:MAG: integration host factor subunit beta [Candidatus Dadabacteria bacterium]
MKKSDLVTALADEMGISKRMAKEAVDLFFEMMTRSLERGERIEIRGFGSFRVHRYNGYRGRNPRTGETVDVLPKRLPLFRQSRLLEVDEDQRS